MLQFYEKRTWRGWLGSWWLLLILVPVTLMLLLVVFERYQIERDMAARRAAAEAKLSELQAREAELAETVTYLESERGIEAEMRRNFDVAEPGEQVVVILDVPASKDSTSTKSQTPSAAAPWYLFWR